MAEQSGRRIAIFAKVLSIIVKTFANIGVEGHYYSLIAQSDRHIATNNF